MPTVGLPGMRSIRIDSACKPRHRSSVSVVMRVVLHAGFGLELEGGDHGSGIDLHHRAAHVELLELGLDAGGGFLQLLAVEGAAGGRLAQQSGGRQHVLRALRRGLRRWTERRCAPAPAAGSAGRTGAGPGGGSRSSRVRIGMSSSAGAAAAGSVPPTAAGRSATGSAAAAAVLPASGCGSNSGSASRRAASARGVDFGGPLGPRRARRARRASTGRNTERRARPAQTPGATAGSRWTR